MGRDAPSPGPDRAAAVEAEISEVLLLALAPGASALLLSGLLLTLAPGAASRLAAWLPAPAQLLRLGILGWISLPIFRAGAALVAFLAEADAAYLLLSGAVLALLMYSFYLACPW